jgi:CDP-paratose 2-epimerase
MRILITGGAGFIGANFAARLLRHGHAVTILDNMSRQGCERNLTWLRTQGVPTVVEGDIRDVRAVESAVAGQDAVYHLAGQVAVTTSVQNPREDFEINALGTFNVLEASRMSAERPLVVYASTNKVYGGLEDVRIAEGPTRYAYPDELASGVPETQPLDFHSPYGCSKGCGDQYVRDYARIYGLRTVVFRQSCIYGPRQFGVEDQGWLAHFAIATLKGVVPTIYGDGKQVRDVLWVDDLLDAYEAVLHNPNLAAGEVFNIGGGAEFSVAVWAETRDILEAAAGRPLTATFADWRPGDQRIYVSDIRKARSLLGWTPKIGPQEGITKLWRWVEANAELFDVDAPVLAQSSHSLV